MTSTYTRSIFFNDTATTEIYTLSLHDALPILQAALAHAVRGAADDGPELLLVERQEAVRGHHLDARARRRRQLRRSEEHTSELQSRQYLVCRLLLEKKKTRITTTHINVHQTLD